MSKTRVKLPDTPRVDQMSPEEMKQFLDALIRALYDVQAKTVFGPVNVEPFILTNYTDTRHLDGMTASLPDVRDVLCTLIQLLKTSGVIK